MIKKNPPLLMGHIVGGYPDKDSSIQVGLGIIEGGASFLEVQFPFSDPNADGPIIENACNEALKRKISIEDGFDIVQTLAKKTKAKILIMTYANIAYTYGIESFVRKAKSCGAKGLIIPDLVMENDEDLRKISQKYDIDVVELITIGMSEKRIKKLSKTSCEFVYVVARSGITGNKTEINQEVLDWINFVKSHCDKKIALGFGIQSSTQIKALKDKVDIVVAGSYFVKKTSLIQKDFKNALKKYTQELLKF